MQLDEDMQQHDGLLALIEKSPESVDAIVARQRKDFTEHFFEHLRLRIQASYDDRNRREGMATPCSHLFRRSGFSGFRVLAWFSVSLDPHVSCCISSVSNYVLRAVYIVCHRNCCNCQEVPDRRSRV